MEHTAIYLYQHRNSLFRGVHGNTVFVKSEMGRGAGGRGRRWGGGGGGGGGRKGKSAREVCVCVCGGGGGGGQWGWGRHTGIMAGGSGGNESNLFFGLPKDHVAIDTSTARLSFAPPFSAQPPCNLYYSRRVLGFCLSLFFSFFFWSFFFGLVLVVGHRVSF